jgi:hypothetical protein
VQATLIGDKAALYPTDCFAPYPDMSIQVLDLGGNICYDIKRMEHGCLLNMLEQGLPSSRFPQMIE